MYRLKTLVGIVCVLGLALDAVGEDKEKRSLADAIVAVQVDQLHWIRISHALALGAEIGIPNEQLQSQLPQSKLKTLPREVLEALQQGSAGIPAWAACVTDERPTGIHENDAFNGTSSDASRLLTCREAAIIVLSMMTPSGKVEGIANEDGTLRVRDAAIAWGLQIDRLSSSDRIREWLKLSNRRDQMFFLGFIYQTGHASAYPVVEAWFLERAKAPDVMFFLEVSAYFRHRRAGAKEFLSQLIKTIPKPLEIKELREDDIKFFEAMWGMLTRYANIDAATEAWIAGQCSADDLTELIQRSVDQPWAYHSRPVEPVEVHIPVMEDNLIGLVRAAQRQDDLNRRLALLQFANEALEVLTSIRQHAHFLDDPDNGRTSSRWLSTATALQKMLDDSREVISDFGRPSSPSIEAAKLVWTLWGPDSQSRLQENGQPIQDWRKMAMYACQSHLGPVIVPASKEVYSRTEPILPEPFPENESPKLAAELFTGTAHEMREKYDNLPWRSKLLALSQLQFDTKISPNLYPTFLVFTEWRPANVTGDPPPFESVWREQLMGHSLDEKAWNAMKSWLVTEARAGRHWQIVAESALCRPGFTVIVMPTVGTKYKGQSILEANLTGIYSQPERYRITPQSMEPISSEEWLKLIDDDGEDFLNKAPKPMDALREEFAEIEKRGFGSPRDRSFRMGVGLPQPQPRRLR